MHRKRVGFLGKTLFSLFIILLCLEYASLGHFIIGWIWPIQINNGGSKIFCLCIGNAYSWFINGRSNMATMHKNCTYFIFHLFWMSTFLTFYYILKMNRQNLEMALHFQQWRRCNINVVENLMCSLVLVFFYQE